MVSPATFALWLNTPAFRNFVLGLFAALIGLAATGTVGWWGWLGVVPLATGLLGWCPPYAIFGFSTCPAKT